MWARGYVCARTLHPDCSRQPENMSHLNTARSSHVLHLTSTLLWEKGSSLWMSQRILTQMELLCNTMHGTRLAHGIGAHISRKHEGPQCMREDFAPRLLEATRKHVSPQHSSHVLHQTSTLLCEECNGLWMSQQILTQMEPQKAPLQHDAWASSSAWNRGPHLQES